MVAPLKGPPAGGQDGSSAEGLELGKIRTATSITGSPFGTPSCDLPCRRPFVAIEEFLRSAATSQPIGPRPHHSTSGRAGRVMLLALTAGLRLRDGGPVVHDSGCVLG